MKISELMEKLGEIQGEHGDVEIKAYAVSGSLLPVRTVEYEPEFGNYQSFVKIAP